MTSRSQLSLLCTVCLAACTGGEARPVMSAADSARVDSLARARQDSINRAQPGYIVDSIFPLPEAIRRFKAVVGGDSVTELQHASGSREALIRRFVKAVVASDTSALRDMVLSPREFVDLVYPSSPYAHPPYNEDPGRVWMLIMNPSLSGLIRIYNRLGGRPMDYVGHSCDPKPARQGKNLLWTKCFLHIREPDGSLSTHRYFGTIIQRDGRFKIVSYTNEF